VGGRSGEFVEYVSRGYGVGVGLSRWGRGPVWGGDDDDDEGGEGEGWLKVGEGDVELYRQAVEERSEEPLKVEKSDYTKKRYLAYGQWVLTGRLKRQGGVRL
jgi:hypothetical protein